MKLPSPCPPFEVLARLKPEDQATGDEPCRRAAHAHPRGKRLGLIDKDAGAAVAQRGAQAASSTPEVGRMALDDTPVAEILAEDEMSGEQRLLQRPEGGWFMAARPFGRGQRHAGVGQALWR